MKKTLLLILIAAGLVAFYHSRAGTGQPGPEGEGLRLSGQVEVQEAAPNPVQVLIQVDQLTLDRIRPGQPARVRTNSGKLYEGRVGLISARVEDGSKKGAGSSSPAPDSIYHLRVIVDKPGPDLRPGLPVAVELPQTGNYYSGD